MTKLLKLGVAGATTLLCATPALAQDAAADPSPYILTTLLFLVGGFLVFWMAAGFAMLEAGLVRSKNVTTQLTKNISLFAIASIMYWLVGVNLMYPGDAWTVAGIVGAFFPTALEPVGLAAADATLDYASVGSDFFFQLMFCATTASIVSGTLAERIKLWPFLIFVVVLTGFIYPIEASWQWGGGFLSEMGFSDFAGSTLGTFILWLGWFGFNGGSQLAMGTVGDVTDISRIFANTNMAAAAGAVVALILTQVVYGKVDLTMVLNGALAGLVSITAEPLAPSLFMALIVGGIGGVIVVFTVPMLDKLKIDDVVGAIPVHLIAGIWGTMAVPLTNGGTSFVTQAIGVISIGLFVFIVSFIVWTILKVTMGIRVDEESEIVGLDATEMGMEAYPEFTKG